MVFWHFISSPYGFVWNYIKLIYHIEMNGKFELTSVKYSNILFLATSPL